MSEGNATASKKVALKTLLQARPWNEPLRNGAVTSGLLGYDFKPVSEVSDGFKPMVRDLAYDCGELAIVTFLQAKAYGKPLVLLPFVVSGNFQHKSFAYNAEKGEMTLSNLAGRRIGVRTYSQTTGVWIRGILQNDYGADLSKVIWVTFNDAHLAEHVDPENCERAPAGAKLVPMLLGGELDGALLGSNMPADAKLKTLIPNAEQAAKDWAAKHQIRPINHMFVVTKALCESRPDLVREIFGMLVKARPAGASPFPSGLDADWKVLDRVSEYAFQQGVIPRRISVDEIFADAARVLQ